MKKNTLILLILFSFIWSSCCCDCDPVYVPMKTTTVQLQFSAINLSSLNSKNVNRNSIPLAIEGVIATAKGLNVKHYTQEIFHLVSSGGKESFDMTNVALGWNEFTVSTTTTVKPESYFELYDNQRSNPSNPNDAQKLTKLNDKTPYALFHSGAIIQKITVGNRPKNTVSIPLKTHNSRVITTVKLDETLAAMHYNCEVTVSLNGVNLATKTITSTKDGVVYWSGPSCIVGSELAYTFELHDNSPENKLIKTIVINSNTHPEVCEIKAGKSVNSTFTVTLNNDILMSFNTATFNFEPFGEEN
jgi:hypothetical protein